MAKKKKSQFGTTWYERQKPKKRPGVHKKTLNKSEKRNKKLTRYKGGGR